MQPTKLGDGSCVRAACAAAGLDTKFAVLVSLALVWAPGVYAQGPSQAEIDKFLDGGWSQQTGAPAQTAPAFPSQQFGRFMQGPQQPSPLRLPQGRSLPAFPAAGQAAQTPFGRLTPRDVFRIMFGGGSAPDAPQDQGRNNNAIYGAQGQLQVARDQAAQAESAASRAQYGSSYERQSAAAEAQNHANAARAAADRATSQAAGGPSPAQDAAAQARNEAARAQYAADRAHANAANAGW